jgi:molybdate transport system ATP-binding protein
VAGTVTPPAAPPATGTPTGVQATLGIRRPSGFVLDLPLDLPAGRTTALLGPNGAGKSTALAALAGLLRLDTGRIVLDGEVVDDATTDRFVPARDRRVGVVFQDGRLFAHLTVLDNVAFGPRSRGAARTASRATARTWLDRLGLAGLARRRPAQLSGGEAQRVALARALASEPRLVLLDEPLSALDVQGRTALRRTLAEHLPTLDAPRLLVTHDPIEASLLADRVAIVEDGRLTQVGTPEEIRERPRTPYAAELAGTNLLRGRADGGAVDVAGHVVHVAERAVRGEVLLTVAPHAIALSLDEPHTSARNVWRTVVDRVEPMGDRVRVSVHRPVPLTAEVTPAAVADLGLAPGRPVWVAIKATEVAVTPDA